MKKKGGSIQFVNTQYCILNLLNPSFGVAELPLEHLSISEDFMKRHAFEEWLKEKAGLPIKGSPCFIKNHYKREGKR
jgi:hypothetical protein